MTKKVIGIVLEWGDGWVALDSQSGGYPCQVKSGRDAYVFSDVDDAQRYADRVGLRLCQPRLLFVEAEST